MYNHLARTILYADIIVGLFKWEMEQANAYRCI